MQCDHSSTTTDSISGVRDEVRGQEHMSCSTQLLLLNAPASRDCINGSQCARLALYNGLAMRIHDVPERKHRHLQDLYADSADVQVQNMTARVAQVRRGFVGAAQHAASVMLRMLNFKITC